MFCQSESTCPHQKGNMVVLFLKIMKIPTEKGEHSCKCTELSLNKKSEYIYISVPLLRPLNYQDQSIIKTIYVGPLTSNFIAQGSHN